MESRLEKRVAELLSRAAHPATPVEEARTSAAIAAKMAAAGGLSCLDREALVRRIRAERPFVPPPPPPPPPRQDPYEKWGYLAAGILVGGTFAWVGSVAARAVASWKDGEDEAPAPAPPSTPAPSAPRPSAPRPSVAARTVVVEQGDSPWRIALRLGAAKRPAWWAELKRANPSKQVLPSGRWASLHRGETLNLPPEWDFAGFNALLPFADEADELDVIDEGPFAS